MMATGGELTTMPKCDRCGFRRTRFEDARFWSGNWTERRHGVRQVYSALCDDCHRLLVREN